MEGAWERKEIDREKRNKGKKLCWAELDVGRQSAIGRLNLTLLGGLTCPISITVKSSRDYLIEGILGIKKEIMDD